MIASKLYLFGPVKSNAIKIPRSVYSNSLVINVDHFIRIAKIMTIPRIVAAKRVASPKIRSTPQTVSVIAAIQNHVWTEKNVRPILNTAPPTKSIIPLLGSISFESP